MDLQGYARAIRKSWWVILVCVALGLGAAAGLTWGTPPRYQSSVTFFVSTPSDVTGTAVQGGQYATQRVNSYASLLQSDRLAEMIVAKGNVTGLSPAQVKDEITSSVDLNTVLLTALVVDTSPDRALQITTAIATEFGNMVGALDNRGTSKSPTVVLNVTSGPTVDRVPVTPRKTLNLGLGLVAGLLLGAAAAIVRQLLDTTVRSSELLRAVTRHPSLGVVGFDPKAKRTPLVTDDARRSIRAEAFRQIRTNLQFVDLETPVKVLVVTSSVANEGKSATAANLSLVFAQAGRKVLLIGADLRRPKIAEYFGLEGAVGLTNVLAGQVDLHDALQQWGDGGLVVLPSGSIPPNPSELLGGGTMAALVGRLRDDFDLIIMDTPPLLPVTDAAVTAAHADGVVVVVRHGRTKRGQITAALRSLESVDATILGCVLNMVPTTGPDRYAIDESYGPLAE